MILEIYLKINFIQLKEIGQLLAVNPKVTAKIAALILGLVSLKIAQSISYQFLFIILVYVFIQIAYCIRLKKEPLLDIFCIASGFLLESNCWFSRQNLGSLHGLF